MVGEEDVKTNWKAVQDLGLSLGVKTRDLRVAAGLAAATLHTGGLAGFAQGLDLLARLVRDHWEFVHPRLDPNDGNDPMMRANALKTICALPCRQALDAAVAASANQPEAAEHCRKIGASLDAIDKSWIDHMKVLKAWATEAGIKNRDAVYAATRFMEFDEIRRRIRPLMAAEQQPVAHGEPPQNSGELGGRAEAIRAMEQAAQYFRAHEPSSPIPLLLDRACRLAGLSFIDLVKDMAPNAVEQVRTIVGKKDA
jgi:type VI secretion system protein ImpA